MRISQLKQEVKDWLQKSIKSELQASHLYKYFGNYFQSIGLFNVQKYFLEESKSELGHYQILVDYINDRGDCAELPTIDAVLDRIVNVGDALRIVYETEKGLLEQYLEFYEKAEDEYMDCTTAQFLLQFIEIQRKAVGEVLDLMAYYDNIEVNKNIEFDKFLQEK